MTPSNLSVISCVLSPRDPRPEIKHKASEAGKMLDTWKQAYLDVRKKIEQSGRDARWEFDRKKLFERSDYIAQVCTDIYNVIQVQCMSTCDYIRA